MQFLIVKTSALGDIIHTFPVVGFLKSLYPTASIDWVAEKASAGLLQAHPDVRHVISIDSRVWRSHLLSKKAWGEIQAFRGSLQRTHYDMLFDLQGNSKSALVTWLAKAVAKVGFTFKSAPEWPNVLATTHRYQPLSQGDIRSDYLQIVGSHFGIDPPDHYSSVCLRLNLCEEQLLTSLKEGWTLQPILKVLVCPGSNWRNKQLNDAALNNLLLALVQQTGCHLLFAWGSESEYHFVKSLSDALPNSSVLEKMSLPLLQNVMAHMDLVVAMDSLALHLAATTAVPTFSVFGPSSAAKYKPAGDSHVAIQGACPYGQQFEKRCPLLRSCKTGACIQNLKGEDLIAALKNSLSQIQL